MAIGTPRRLDAGRCGDELFLMMVSTGLDARVLAQLDPALKRRFGRLGIGFQSLGAWWSYDEPEIVVRVDGTEHRASFVAFSNIPFYGGPFRLAPAARLDDRRLQAVLYSGRGRMTFLSFLADLVRGRHLTRSDTWTAAVRSAELSPPPDLGVQIDGDWRAVGDPVRIRLSEQKLLVLVPS